MASKTQTFKVQGMHCASCANIIGRTLSKVPGVTAAQGFYASEEAVVSFDERLVDSERMNQKLKPFGYALVDVDAVTETQSEVVATSHATMSSHNHNHAAPADLQQLEQEKAEVELLVPLAVVVFLGMMWELLAKNFSSIPALPLPEMVWMFLQFILASITLFVYGRQFLQALWLFIRLGKANMDTLVGMGTSVAYLYSVIAFFFATTFANLGLQTVLYFDVTIVVIAFVKLGKYLEARSKLKTSAALVALMQLQAKTAWVKKGTIFVEVPITQIQTDDLVQVKPGAAIPVDGVVAIGDAMVDEAMITGESLPVSKRPGDTVIAGTINTDGALVVQAKQVGEHTVLAQIITLVKKAQNSKAPIERLADQISAIFVPVVLAIAIAAFVFWLVWPSASIGQSNQLAFALTALLSVLVIACPCALGLATPTAMIVGVGQAALKGILVKNAESLEKLHQVTAVVFDKTGTLTTGKPSLQQIVSLSNKSEQDLLIIAASLEQHSEHPVAQAINQEAVRRNLTLSTVKQFKNLAGRGVRGMIGKQSYYLLSHQAVLQRYPKFAIDVAQFQSGESLLFIANDKTVLGVMSVADQLKDTTQMAIADLQRLGVHLVMLSGDRQATAAHFASILGIDEVIGEVQPAAKLEKIKQLQQQGYVVAMVGDGVNDAPALAVADVGIAMSTGTEVAMSTAAITLLKGDLRKVATAISVSKAVMQTVKQNLFWAFAYNTVGIPLAAGVFYPLFGWLLNPAFAGMAMAFSSVSVVLNSLRLQFKMKRTNA